MLRGLGLMSEDKKSLFFCVEFQAAIKKTLFSVFQIALATIPTQQKLHHHSSENPSEMRQDHMMKRDESIKVSTLRVFWY